MFRSVVLPAAICLLVSCTKETGTPKPAAPAGKGAVGAPAAAPTEAEKSKFALPISKSAVEKAKEASENTAGELKKSASSGEAEVREAVEGAAEVAKGAPDLGGAAQPSFTLEKFKEVIGSLTPEKLKELAGMLVAAIQSKDGAVKGLQEEIGKLGLQDAGKIGELRKNLEAAGASLKGLREKLQLVVGKLKESGADVSEFTTSLKGE